MNKEKAIKTLISFIICHSNISLGCDDCYHKKYSNTYDCGLDDDVILDAVKYLQEQLRIDEINKEAHK